MTLDVGSVIFGAFLTLTGILISHFYHLHEKRRSKHEKAIEVAKEYESIMTSGNFSVQRILYEVNETLSINSHLSFLDKDIDSLTFNISEANENIGPELIDKFKSFTKFDCTNFIQILAKQYSPKNERERIWKSIISKFDVTLTTQQNLEKVSEIISDLNIIFEKENDEEYKTKKELMVRREVHSFIVLLVKDYIYTYNHLLNKLEWMSMFFVSGVAESDVVYQSLHQGYFSLVQCFYIGIASLNNKEVYDRYYVNITKLYKIWKKKYNKKASKFSKQKRRSEKLERNSEKLISIGRQRV